LKEGDVFTPQLSTHIKTHAVEGAADWSYLTDVARAADAAGIDRLVVSDHVVYGEHLDAYGDPAIGGEMGGKQPGGPDTAWLDPLTTIAHLSAVTTSVRFATNILIAALRRPVVLAKMAATIDVLSGGRLDIGVGVGWQREEYEAAGLSFEGRGRLLDHSIEVCLELWRNDRVSYNSDELTFTNIHQMPKPVQSDGIPIWTSGTVNRRAMNRLATYGVGWIPWGPDADDIERGIARMHRAVADLGRDPTGLGVVGTLREIADETGNLDLARTMEPVPRYREAGVTDFRIALKPPEGVVHATEYYQEVVSAFHAATA
jgi:probable F420-dependent oxidoreductase